MAEDLEKLTDDQLLGRISWTKMLGAVVRVLYENEEVSTSQVKDRVRIHLRFPERVMTLEKPNIGKAHFGHQIDYLLTQLKKLGLDDRPRHGMRRLTAKGREIWEDMKDREEDLTLSYIKTHYLVHGANGGSGGKEPKTPKTPSPPVPPEGPPRAREYPLNTILYGPPGTGKTYAVAGRCVEICEGEPEKGDNQPRYRKLREEGRVEFVTFHQSYGYEEFIEGLRPEPKKGGGFKLVPTPGILKRIAELARKEPRPHVLVIDEINRANVSKVFGELITLLEEDKREGRENAIKVKLPHSKELFTLPANLYVLGTMNTADRSIALLDTALRRRFRFEEMIPDPKKLGKVDGIDLRRVLEAVNERLEWLLDRDHRIGHAWFMSAKSKADVDEIMTHKIVPLVAEYFYDDWEKVRSVLGGTEDFVKKSKLKPPPGLETNEEQRYSWNVVKNIKIEGYERLVGGNSSENSEEG